MLEPTINTFKTKNQKKKIPIMLEGGEPLVVSATNHCHFMALN